jgi:hypothetical protein
MIRVLAIAQQTLDVGGNSDDGKRDGILNAQAVIDGFGKGYLVGADPNIIVFLDVEHGNDRLGRAQPPLTVGYYMGWSEALQDECRKQSAGTLAMFPAIYASRSNMVTWNSLRAAIGAGAICAGAWVARWRDSKGGCFRIEDWDDDHVTPEGGLPCPILAWQYTQECDGVDCSQINPAHEDMLVNRLVLPPAPLVS